MARVTAILLPPTSNQAAWEVWVDLRAWQPQLEGLANVLSSMTEGTLVPLAKPDLGIAAPLLAQTSSDGSPGIESFQNTINSHSIALIS